MADYNVFVSHSMSQEDLGIIYQAARDAQFRGINCYVAERDVQLGKSLPAKIDNAIRSCDCFVVFLTNGGASSVWVNQEIGLARGCGKLRIQVVEKGVQIKGFDIDKEYLVLDRWNPAAAISTLNEHLVRLKSEKESKQAIALFVVGALALLALLGSSK
jgi:TIR domain